MNKKEFNEWSKLHQRERRKDPEYREHQRLYYREWYKRNGRSRADDYAEIILEWKQEHPERVKACRKVRDAVKKGRLVKPNICEQCKRDVRVFAHHEDYSKPLSVVWLCASCHKLKHSRSCLTNP